MKKILALILILTMCLSLALFAVSCGGEETPGGENPGEQENPGENPGEEENPGAENPGEEGSGEEDNKTNIGPWIDID